MGGGSVSNQALQPWRTLSSECTLSDSPWLKLSTMRVELPSGKIIERFYRVDLPTYAMIVPITKSNRVVMVRQYKHGVGKVIMNLPGGYVEQGETPLEAAQRELLEETGFEAEIWHHLGKFCIDGNRGCGEVHCFVAGGAQQVRCPQQDPTEELELILQRPDEALEHLTCGRIGTVGPAIALALAYLAPVSPLRHERQTTGL